MAYGPIPSHCHVLDVFTHLPINQSIELFSVAQIESMPPSSIMINAMYTLCTVCIYHRRMHSSMYVTTAIARCMYTDRRFTDLSLMWKRCRCLSGGNMTKEPRRVNARDNS